MYRGRGIPQLCLILDLGVVRLENENIALDLVLPHRTELSHNLPEFVHSLGPSLLFDVEDLEQPLHRDGT